MKFIKKSAVWLAVVAMTISARAQVLDVFNSLRILPMATNNTIGLNKTVQTNGPFDMVGYVGRGVLIASAETPSVSPAGTVLFNLQSSPDTTNWYNVTNYAVITNYTAIIYTNLGVVYNQTIYTSTNFQETNLCMLPGVTTYPSAPYNGFNTPYQAPNLFTNGAANTGIPANGTPVVWSVNANDQQRYWQLIWTATGGATNGINPSNAIVNATWIGNWIKTSQY